MGRAARHLNGRAILYADKMTDSMRRAIDETDAAARDSAGLQRGERDHAESVIRSADMSLAQILKADYAEVTRRDGLACRSSSRRKSWTHSSATGSGDAGGREEVRV